MATIDPQQKWQTKSVIDAFRHAADGMAYCLRTQRHMPYYFVLIFVALLSGMYLKLSKIELLFVFSAIMLVLLAEMLNTAAETIVNLVRPDDDQKAKIAKDSASAAVLVACCYAMTVVVIVYFNSERVRDFLSGAFLDRSVPMFERWLIGLVLVVLLIMAAKQRSTRGTLFRGGIVSGHSALAFFMATCLLFAISDKEWSICGFVLAALVAQSRVEGQIHSVREVLIGALAGVGLAAVVHLVGLGFSGAL